MPVKNENDEKKYYKVNLKNVLMVLSNKIIPLIYTATEKINFIIGGMLKAIIRVKQRFRPERSFERIVKRPTRSKYDKNKKTPK